MGWGRRAKSASETRERRATERLASPTDGQRALRNSQIARWSFGAGLVLGYLHNPIWHLITAIIPFI